MGHQRYVSNELTHFVGRKEVDDEAKYNLLVKILRKGRISHPPHEGGTFGITYDPSIRLKEFDLNVKIFTCFCDIPLSEFFIHIKKYGGFGVAFSREFIVTRGGNPVFYIADESLPRWSLNLKGLGKNKRKVSPGLPTRELYYDTYPAEVIMFITCFIYLTGERLPGSTEEDYADRTAEIKAYMNENMGIDEEGYEGLRKILDGNRQFLETCNTLWFFLLLFFVGYMKSFSTKLPEDHEDNYYMEREWRVLGRVEFTLADVQRVILPRAYARRFRQEFPDYYGQVHFSDPE